VGAARSQDRGAWRGALATGRPAGRDQQGVRRPATRAQRRQTAAPARLSADVGPPAAPPRGRRGAGGAQKNFAELVAGVVPEAARGKPLELWWQDEARVGQQGSLTYIWAEKGSRPTALRDQRFTWAYLFGAVCPARGTGAALVLPLADTAAMTLHLAEIGSQVAPGAHAVVVLDGAGWHRPAGRLRLPDNISLLHLPPYSPELNPVENIWQFLRQNHLGNRVFDTYDAIVDACCAAWNALIAAPERIRSIATRDWAKTVGA